MATPLTRVDLLACSTSYDLWTPSEAGFLSEESGEDQLLSFDGQSNNSNDLTSLSFRSHEQVSGEAQPFSRRTFLASAAMFLTTGCSLGPALESPKMQLPSQFAASKPSSPRHSESDKWWMAFKDPVLNEIVEIGLRQNLDIRKAVARIKQSEGLAAGAGYPLSGTIRIGEGKISDSSGSVETVATGFVRAEASWRLDLFGELEKERQAGRANLDAAYEDVNVWRLILISDVISAYVDLRYTQELLRITK